MKDMIFTFLLGSGEGEAYALRLARSIRTFGGQYCFNPIWMLSQRSEEDLSERTRQELFSIGARLVTFDLGPQEPPFPFSAYVTAAGIAEGLAQGETSVLVMMAGDTLVLQEPTLFLLPPGVSFAGCPVHLKLLGSGAEEPVNEFWKLIYSRCRVQEERIFLMQTIADEQSIRAYFNAGLLVVRPERGLLRGWQANFERFFRLPEFEPFYQQTELYKVFMHQAVLAGCLLSALKENEIQMLPFEVNYPLHLHSKIAEARRISTLGDLITCRYEDFADTFGTPTIQGLRKQEPYLDDWLQGQIA
ncbi:MAG TPA: hypothetical protein VLD65_10230 [Anaerolineales bacterium]|nr:hypothetical protein [Anaerolineales bacterium]